MRRNPSAQDGLMKTISSDHFLQAISAKAAESRRPEGVTFELTYGCNLRCVHCYSSSGASPESLELTDDKCVRLVDEISALKPPIVLLSGGEPLMRKNVFDIVRACKSGGLRVGLSTNGTLIDKDMAAKIADSGVDYAGISIDGREALHDKLRDSKGAFASSWNMPSSVVK